MTNTKYHYLKCYTENNFGPPPEGYVPPEEGDYGNIFYDVNSTEIDKAESMLMIGFPSELKEFWNEIGSGLLRAPYNCPKNYHFSWTNKILPPLAAATFYKPLDDPERMDKDGNRIEIEVGQSIATADEEYFMSGWTYETLQPGDMPFFEISDGSSFLVMRPHSDNPNAVWSDLGEKVEDSFEKFVWRLYYEHPLYYLKVLDPDFDLDNN